MKKSRSLHLLQGNFISSLSLRATYLISFGKKELIKAIDRAHSGVYGTHQYGSKFQFQIRRMSYYLPN